MARFDRGSRGVGPGVIEAFHRGLETVQLDAFDMTRASSRPRGSGTRCRWARRSSTASRASARSAASSVASAVYRLPRHPVLTGSLAMLWGYFSSAVRRAPRYDDREFRRFLRRYQHASLRVGKAAAARRITQERAGLWYAAHGAPQRDR